MRTNKYYIDESFLRDNESIDQFFYLNQSRYHRYQCAQNEEEQEPDWKKRKLKADWYFREL